MQLAAIDRLICADAEAAIAGEAAAGGADPQTADILVLDDPDGALTRWALQATTGRIFSRQRDSSVAAKWRGHARVLLAGQTEATESLAQLLAAHSFDGQLALGRLPKSHGALRDTATDFARYQSEQNRPATLLLGGNTKHMTHTFNRTLGEAFADVRGLRGQGKHRCLHATKPLQKIVDPPASGPLTAFGGVFSGSQPDHGGRALAAAALAELAECDAPVNVLDLGCGNGSVSVTLLDEAATKLSALTATDIDLDAVRSARANLAAAQARCTVEGIEQPGPKVTVTWDDCGKNLPASSFDLVLLNPPFHAGTAIDMTLVQPLLTAARRLLKPGGVLLLVHNSHARYRGAVAAHFDTVQQIARNSKFTLLRAV